MDETKKKKPEEETPEEKPNDDKLSQAFGIKKKKC